MLRISHLRPTKSGAGPQQLLDQDTQVLYPVLPQACGEVSDSQKAPTPFGKLKEILTMTHIIRLSKSNFQVKKS